MVAEYTQKLAQDLFTFVRWLSEDKFCNVDFSVFLGGLKDVSLHNLQVICRVEVS